jgi:hypothetical protein
MNGHRQAGPTGPFRAIGFSIETSLKLPLTLKFVATKTARGELFRNAKFK